MDPSHPGQVKKNSNRGIFFMYRNQHCFIFMSRMLASSSGLLRLRHWQSDPLPTWLDLMLKDRASSETGSAKGTITWIRIPPGEKAPIRFQNTAKMMNWLAWLSVRWFEGGKHSKRCDRTGSYGLR